MENPRITTKEIALIKEAQAGNMLAFNKLYYRYRDFVSHVLNQFLNDEDEAKDLTNIVFLKVYNKLHLFDSYGSFGGWIRIIANRTALDYLRKASNRLMKPDDESIRLMSDSSEGENEFDVVNRDSYKQILKEVENLPDAARKVFKLFYLNNLTTEQISERLKMPKGTVKSHLSRSRRRIQKKLIKT